MLVFSVQRSEWISCTWTRPPFFLLLSFPLSHPETEQSSLCWTVGAHEFPILYMWHLIFRDPCSLGRSPRREERNAPPSSIHSTNVYWIPVARNTGFYLLSISAATAALPLSVHGVQGRLTPPTFSHPYWDTLSLVIVSEMGIWPKQS